jgi:1-acyl-sn-glycerol-3-phosphate acyltransferase
MVGVSAGPFVVPLNALLQQKAETGEKGRIQAASNFFSTLAMILASLLLDQLSSRFGLAPDRILLLAGLACFGMTAFLVTRLPEFAQRSVLWMATHTLYRLRTRGSEHVPQRGPALLVCTRSGPTDALLVQAGIQRLVRSVVHQPVYAAPALHWLFRAGKAIPSPPHGLDVEALGLANEALRAGHVVCVFIDAGPGTGEGPGHARGLERLLAHVGAPVIPVALDGPREPLFSLRDGRLAWTWPGPVPCSVTVTFSAPLPPDPGPEQLPTIAVRPTGNPDPG